MNITKESLLLSLPEAFAEDEGMAALADGIADILSRRPQEIEKIAMYPNVRELDEELCDTLAYDFKIDWWLDSMTLEEKRDTLAKSWYVHKHMGTKASVQTALSTVYPDVVVEEWFEYGGQPYHFRIRIPTKESSVDPEKHERLMALVRFYKNLRSVLDSVEYSGSSGTVAVYTATAPVMTSIVTEGTARKRGG